MKKLSVVVAAIVGMFAFAAQADLIANWELDGLAASSVSAAAASTHANASSSDLAISAGLNPNGGWPDALVAIQNDATINSLALAITSDDYFSFTITPDAGASVSYSDLFLRYSISANVTPGTTEFSLLSSETGFTSADAIDTFSASATVAGLVTGTSSFDITGASALQNVTAGQAVEFRVYVHNTGANPMTRIGVGQAFNSANGTDDLTLNGTVSTSPIPEPASLSLLGLGALIAFFMARRRIG